MSIPDALLTRPLATVSTMNIETNILDPIVINQNFARFVLERKGILDTGSAITFSLQTTAAGDKKAYLPVKTGIHSLVRRATLRIGSKVVAITDEYPFYQTIRRQFKTAEEKAQKDMVKVGTVDVVCPDNQQTGKLQLRDVDYGSSATDAEVLHSIRLTDQVGHTPIFSIKISELFPAMRNVQLPLYLIAEPCSIELSFNTQADGTDGVLAVFEDGYTDSTQVTLATQNVKFLADYLTYDDNRMEETAKQVMGSGMAIPYEDVVLTSTNFPASNPAPSASTPVQERIVRDLGLSGMNVRAILAHMHKSSTVNKMLGVYSSEAYNVPDSFNVRVNDSQIYPREVQSESQKAYQLSQVFGTDIAVHSAEYSKDIATDKSSADQDVNNNPFSAAKLGGNAQTALLGSSHYLGVDLSISPINAPGNSTKVGQKPVQMLHTITNTNADNTARDVKYFSVVERMMTIKNGQVEVSA